MKKSEPRWPQWMDVLLRVSVFLSCFVFVPIMLGAEARASDYTKEMHEKTIIAKDSVEKHQLRKLKAQAQDPSEWVMNALVSQDERNLIRMPVIRSMCSMSASDPAISSATGVFCDSVAKKIKSDGDPIQNKQTCECFSGLLPFLVSVVGALHDDPEYQKYSALGSAPGQSGSKREGFLSKYSSLCTSIYRVSPQGQARGPSAQTLENLRNLCLDFVSASLQPVSDAK